MQFINNFLIPCCENWKKQILNIMNFIEFLKSIRRKFHSDNSLIRVIIFRDNLIYNLRQFKRQSKNLQVAPVLKSNAYGHGILEAAKILKNENIPFFCLDSLFEARQIRHAGIKNKILIIGFVRQNEILKNSEKNISFAVISLDQLRNIAENSNVRIKIHLKIDTGMHRQGIPISDIPEAINLIKENRNIILEGVMSHLADSDNFQSDFTLEQIKNWNQSVKEFQRNFSRIDYFHLSATAGLSYREKIDANVMRLGLGLYGINSSPNIKLDLKPVLEMRTVISSIKEIDPGDYVGYNATFKANRRMKIATVPVGYNEGMDRRLSNCGFVIVKNKKCPIIGRVSMNISVADVSRIENLKIEDEAIIISSDKNNPNSVESIAKLCHTIPYEILVHISSQLRREVV